MTSAPSSERLDDPLEAIWGVLRRRLWWGAGVFAVVVGLAAIVVLTARPVYVADARLRLGEPPPTAGVSPTSGLFSFLRMGGDPFSNDLELLGSRSLAEGIVRKGVLNARLVAPRGWHRDSIFAQLALQDTTAKATFEASWSDEGTITVERRSPSAATVGTVRPGEPISVGGLRVAFLPRKQDGPRSVAIKTEPFDEAVRVERRRVRVERTRREANVLEISYTHHDPGVAQTVVESAVHGFLALRSELFERESAETIDSLRAVAAGTEKELRAAERALEAIQRETGIIAPDALAEALIERYETLLSRLLEARAERGLIEQQLGRVEVAEDRVAALSTLVANPRFLENETVASLLTRLTELEELQTEARSTLTTDSREVRTLELQVEQLHRTLRTVVDEFVVGLSERIAELERQLAESDRLISELPAQVVELGRRQRAVRVLTEVAVVTETRLRQEELRLALAYSNVQVVDPPTLRFRPVWPRKKFGLAVGVLVGGLVGLTAIVLVERSDTRVRRASSIRNVTGAPVLAAPVVRGGAVTLDASERAAVEEAGGATRRYVTVPGAEAVAGSLVVALALDPEQVGPVRGYADALAVSRAPVVLVVAIGRSTLGALDRVAGLIREAGGRVEGTVAVCTSSREAEGLWS